MENIFIIILGLTMIYLASTSRLVAHINILSSQGWLLLLICLSAISHEDWFGLKIINSPIDNIAHFATIGLIFVETLIVKAILIPLFLKKVLNKTHAHRDSDANIPHFYALVISSLILFGGFMIANIKTPDFEIISPLYFGVAIAIIITSLWLITIKHTVLSNVINFITMENGIFLLSLSAAGEMPIIINLGVLLDIFIAVFILGMLIKEINTEFEDLEVSGLSELKDYE